MLSVSQPARPPVWAAAGQPEKREGRLRRGLPPVGFKQALSASFQAAAKLPVKRRRAVAPLGGKRKKIFRIF